MSKEVSKYLKQKYIVYFLIVISLLGLITIFIIPNLDNTPSKSAMKYKTYENELEHSAKLYVDSHKEDIFASNTTGCQDVSYNELKMAGLLEDINIKNIDCSGAGGIADSSFVRVFKYKDHYAYKTALYCKNTKTNKVSYQTSLPATAYCNNNAEDVTGPKIEFTSTLDYGTTDADFSTGKNEHITIRIWDEFGLLENAQLEYAWFNGPIQLTPLKLHNFQNKRYEGDSRETAISVDIPFPTGNELYTGKEVFLALKSTDIRDANGNYQYFGLNTSDGPTSADEIRHGQTMTKQYYYLDNMAPACNIETLYTNWTNQDRTVSIGCNDHKNSSITSGGYPIEGNVDIVGVGCKQDKYYKEFNKGTTALSNIEISDKLGNKRTCTYAVYIDKEKPSCGAITDSKVWSNQEKKVSVKCKDQKNGSGCQEETYTKIYNIPNVTIKKDTITIKDGAGNEERCEVSAYYDSEAPSCGKVKGSSTNWTKDTRKISVACKDPNSGSGCTKPIFKTTYDQGTVKTAVQEIKDRVGNVAKCPYDVYVDKEKPLCGLVVNASTTWTVEDRTVYVGCVDANNGSGCTEEAYSKTYSAKTIKESSIEISDAVGNKNICPYNVYVDKEPPVITKATGTVTKADSLNYTVNIKATATNATDTGTVSYRYYLSPENKAPSKEEVIQESPIFYNNTCNTTYYGYAVAIDAVGNVSKPFKIGSFRQDCCASVRLLDGNNCSKACDGGTLNQLAFSTYDNSRCKASDKASGGSACNTRACCSITSVKYKNGTNCSQPCNNGGTLNQIAYSIYDDTIKCPLYDKTSGGSPCNTDKNCCASNHTTTFWNVTPNSDNQGWIKNPATCGTGTKYRTGTKYSTYYGGLSYSCGETSELGTYATGVNCANIINAYRCYKNNSLYITTCTSAKDAYGTCTYIQKNGMTTKGTVPKSALTPLNENGTCLATPKTECGAYIASRKGDTIKFNIQPTVEECYPKDWSVSGSGCSKENEGISWFKGNNNGNCTYNLKYSKNRLLTKERSQSWTIYKCNNNKYCTQKCSNLAPCIE